MEGNRRWGRVFSGNGRIDKGGQRAKVMVDTVFEEGSWESRRGKRDGMAGRLGVQQEAGYLSQY